MSRYPHLFARAGLPLVPVSVLHPRHPPALTLFAHFRASLSASVGFFLNEDERDGFQSLGWVSRLVRRIHILCTYGVPGRVSCLVLSSPVQPSPVHITRPFFSFILTIGLLSRRVCGGSNFVFCCSSTTAMDTSSASDRSMLTFPTDTHYRPSRISASKPSRTMP